MDRSQELDIGLTSEGVGSQVSVASQVPSWGRKSSPMSGVEPREMNQMCRIGVRSQGLSQGWESCPSQGRELGLVLRSNVRDHNLVLNLYVHRDHNANSSSGNYFQKQPAYHMFSYF